MVAIRFETERYTLEPEQSVLDCLLQHGAPIPFSCRNGVCQTCMMQALDGQPPEAAQQGLKDTLRMQQYFLACICRPEEELCVALPSQQESAIPATVKSLHPLTKDILLVALRPHEPLDYRPGQFIHLLRDEHLARSYSLASVPAADDHLHLHVRHLPGGHVSGWVHEHLRVGHTVDIRGPAGECFYVPGQPEQPILLIGTGSGLAPLYGILRDALEQGHTGPIRLFHGSRDPDGLYLADPLRELTREYTNFDYVPCLSGAVVPPHHAAGRVHEVALREVPELKNWRVYLCGHPAMVQQAQMQAFLAGAAIQDIYADAFTVNVTTSL